MTTSTGFAFSRQNPVQKRLISFENHFRNTFKTYLREGKKFGDDNDIYHLFIVTVTIFCDVLRYGRSLYMLEFRDASLLL